MYKRVDAKMFADKLMEMEDHSSVVFATTSEKEMEIGNSYKDADNFHFFYYVRKIHDEWYNSHYIVIDYINGGEAHVIALDWNKNDTENFVEILKHVQQFMQDWIPEIYLEVKE